MLETVVIKLYAADCALTPRESAHAADQLSDRLHTETIQYSGPDLGDSAGNCGGAL